ncbi:MAG: hypothetical protein Pg6C_09540 [Treponemataceae bacterium]|nr:MAG: hypothetical protein Pg6C_09540 [Treponemataceae bacterium]
MFAIIMSHERGVRINAARLFFLCACCGALILAGCATTSSAVTAGGANAPRWVLSPGAEYSNDSYLTAVGWDKTRASSEANAKAELVRTIRQTVQTQTTTAVSFAENNGAFTESRSAESEVSTFANLEVAGLVIKETWRDRDGTYYSLAFLDRNDAGRYYRTVIQKNTEVIDSLIAYASSNQERFDSYSALKRALNLALENDENLYLLSAINPGMYSLVKPDYGSSQSVAEFSKRVLGKIRIAVSITGDEGGAILSAFIKVLTDAGFNPSLASQGNYPYTLKITANIENVGLVGRYETVRWTLDAALTDVVNGKVLLPYTVNGRESHTTQAEARRRAIRLINDEIAASFAARFQAFLR